MQDCEFKEENSLNSKQLIFLNMQDFHTITEKSNLKWKK